MQYLIEIDSKHNMSTMWRIFNEFRTKCTANVAKS